MRTARPLVSLSLVLLATCSLGCSESSSSSEHLGGGDGGDSRGTGAGRPQGTGTGAGAGGSSAASGGGGAGSGGSPFQPSTAFEADFHAWQTPDGGYAGSGYALTADSLGAADDEAWAMIDMNGDGRPDLVVTSLSGQQFGSPGARVWHVYENTGTRFASTPIEWPTPDGGITGSGYAKVDNYALTPAEEAWTTLDLDGDGRPDLVVTGQNSTQFGPAGGRYWKFYENTGHGFASNASSWSTPNGGFNGPGSGFAVVHADTSLSQDDAWFTLDMDGDGRPDLVVTGNKDIQFGSGDDRVWHVYRNTGSGFESQATDWRTPKAAIEFLGFNTSWYSTVETDNEIWGTTDINGDRRPDLVIASRSGEQYGTVGARVWHVHVNTGSGFAPTPIQWTTPAGGKADGGFFFIGNESGLLGDEAWTPMDLDGDGRVELVVPSLSSEAFGTEGARGWHVYENDGSGFAQSPSFWPIPDGGIGDGGFAYTWYDWRGVGAPTWKTSDLDGDGRPDLVVTSNAASDEFGSPGDRFWRVYFGAP